MACFSWCVRAPGAYWVCKIQKLISGELGFVGVEMMVDRASTLRA